VTRLRRPCIVVLVASLALMARGSATASAPRTPPDVHRDSVQISSYGLVFVRAVVNGRPELALLDTGSSSTLELSPSLAADLAIPLISDTQRTIRGHDGRGFAAQWGRADSVSLAGYVVRNVPFDVPGDRVDGIAREVGTPFRLIVGWGFVSRFRMLLDYAHRRLEISDLPIARRRARLTVTYDDDHLVPVVRAQMDSMALQLLVDTGAPMCSLSPERAGGPQLMSAERKLRLGRARVSAEWRVKDLSVIRRGLGCDGVIGNNLLDRYAISFDPIAKRMRWY
jgi:predicted aspartyl protease